RSSPQAGSRTRRTVRSSASCATPSRPADPYARQPDEWHVARHARLPHVAVHAQLLLRRKRAPRNMWQSGGRGAGDVVSLHLYLVVAGALDETRAGDLVVLD